MLHAAPKFRARRGAAREAKKHKVGRGAAKSEIEFGAAKTGKFDENGCFDVKNR